jgi:hypothetical protein
MNISVSYGVPNEAYQIPNIFSINLDDLVKCSPAPGGTRRAKTEERSILTGTWQRFTLLDLFLNDFHPWRSASLLAIPKGEVSYLTGQG